jgi:hypothetical protein
LICVNKSCAIIAHSKPSSKWVQPERVVFVHPAIKVARLLTAFVLPGTVLSGDGLPEDVLWTASDATKTPKQWLTEFMPFARMKAAEMCRLEEEDEEEEESLADYQFGMEVDVPDGPTGVTWEPIPIVIYPPFMGEEELRRLGDDGLYATEIREAITGVRARLTDAQLAARADAETLVEYVDRSSNWLMEHVDILHCCGDCLQTAVGDIAALTARFLSPHLPTVCTSSWVKLRTCAPTSTVKLMECSRTSSPSMRTSGYTFPYCDKNSIRWEDGPTPWNSIVLLQLRQ